MGDSLSTDRAAIIAENNGFIMEVYGKDGEQKSLTETYPNAIFDDDGIISNHSGRYQGMEYEGIIFGDDLQLIKIEQGVFYKIRGHSPSFLQYKGNFPDVTNTQDADVKNEVLEIIKKLNDAHNVVAENVFSYHPREHYLCLKPDEISYMKGSYKAGIKGSVMFNVDEDLYKRISEGNDYKECVQGILTSYFLAIDQILSQ